MKLLQKLKSFNPNSFVIDDVFKVCDKIIKHAEKRRMDEEEAELLELQHRLPMMDEIIVGNYEADPAMSNPKVLRGIYVGIRTINNNGPWKIRFVE